MSIETFVFFERNKLPTAEALQNEIRNIGFDLELPHSLDLVEERGKHIKTLFENQKAG